jgi:hypothetical protein
MSNAHDFNKLADLLQTCGVGWLLTESRDERLRQIRSEIDALSAELKSRLAPMSVDAFQEMLNEQASLKPLVQMFASPTTTEMRAMVYCVLRGMDIAEVEFAYKLKSSVRLSIVLDDPTTGQDLRFESTLIWDAEVLRHMGIMTLGKKPVLHGFYAFAS